jgi:hypothetical protein
MKNILKLRNTSAVLLRAIIILLLIASLDISKASGQVFEVKKWTGTYPDMNGTYPMAFIAFKGGIIGVPYLFIRSWPTHYYWNALSVPVIDATEVSGKTKTGLAKIIMKLIEQSLMNGRYIEKGLIKINTKQQQEIVQKIFDTRFDQLDDLRELTEMFLKVYHKIDRISGTGVNVKIKSLLKEEANELFSRFLLVNLLESNHGDKIDSFGNLKTEITNLLGEVDYTFKKLQYFESFGMSAQVSYSFLTQ